jgi:hypothetical protein
MEPPQEQPAGWESGGWPGWQCAGPPYNREERPRRRMSVGGHGDVLPDIRGDNAGARRIARVAVARKIVTLVYSGLRDGTIRSKAISGAA